MSVVRSAGSFSRCIRCHRHTLYSFMSLAGLSPKPSPRQLQSLPRRTFPLRHYSEARATATSETNSQGGELAGIISELETPRQSREEDHNIEDIKQDLLEQLEEDEALPSQHETTSDIPWYLQETDTTTPEISLAERQRLPTIPSDAPARIKEVLDRLSLDIGLDYLQLVDLRTLDPPPALGAGVIMIIGTARSEKHLHVSADRFARWLRSAYKLTPRADGLLGRNELKVRIKRRARRAKLLGSVGATPKADEDDGTRVGWICVDAGVLERGAGGERALDGEGTVGFGGSMDGTKLVVQILTEEKRRELDLEMLWERAFERQRKRLARAEEEAEGEEGEQMLR